MFSSELRWCLFGLRSKTPSIAPDSALSSVREAQLLMVRVRVIVMIKFIGWLSGTLSIDTMMNPTDGVSV